MNEKNDVEIFVVMHKSVNLEKMKLDKIYKRLLVGQNSTDEKDILIDSTKDNISEKNKFYCELTGLYWIWKNIKCEYIGLCHYRRFFKKNNSYLTKNDILKILNNKKKDIILPPKWYTILTVDEVYKKSHIASDLERCRQVIEEIYPEYLESFDKIMKGHSVHTLNMFVAKKELIDKYCEWLFTILSNVEKRIELGLRNDYQKRVFGFLAERLFNVWIEKNNLEVYVYNVENTEQRFSNKVKSKINNIIVKTILKLKQFEI